MKKTIAGVIAMIVALLIVSSVVAFAEGEAILGGTSVEAKPGDTVSITFSISGNPGIVALDTEISYDANVLTLKSTKDQNQLGLTGTGNKDLNANPYTFNWDGENASAENGALLALEFEVKSDAADGQYAVVMKALKARDNDGNLVAIASGTSNVSVTTVTTTEKPTDPTTTTEPPKSADPTTTTQPPKVVDPTTTTKPTTTEKPSVDPTTTTQPPQNGGSKGGNGGKTTSIPRTGDAGISTVVAVAVIALGVATVAVVSKKKNDE